MTSRAPPFLRHPEYTLAVAAGQSDSLIRRGEPGLVCGGSLNARLGLEFGFVAAEFAALDGDRGHHPPHLLQPRTGIHTAPQKF